jgi:hypothetical protein
VVRSTLPLVSPDNLAWHIMLIQQRFTEQYSPRRPSSSSLWCRCLHGLSSAVSLHMMPTRLSRVPAVVPIRPDMWVGYWRVWAPRHSCEDGALEGLADSDSLDRQIRLYHTCITASHPPSLHEEPVLRVTLTIMLLGVVRSVRRLPVALPLIPNRVTSSLLRFPPLTPFLALSCIYTKSRHLAPPPCRSERDRKRPGSGRETQILLFTRNTGTTILAFYASFPEELRYAFTRG